MLEVQILIFHCFYNRKGDFCDRNIDFSLFFLIEKVILEAHMLIFHCFIIEMLILEVYWSPSCRASKSKFATSSPRCVLFMFFSFIHSRELSPVYRGSLGAGASGWLAGWGGGGLMGPPHGPP